MNPGRVNLNTPVHRKRKNEPTMPKTRVVRTTNFYYVFTTIDVHNMPGYAKIGDVV